MKSLFRFIIICLLLLPGVCAIAQEKLNIKYGQITPRDFDLSNQKVDTSVHAVMLANIGSTSFETNSKEWFSLIYKRHCRIKILNKSAFDEATIEVPLFSEGSNREKIEHLKAATYNLENGNVVETKLNTDEVYKDKVTKNFVIRKFTLPAVKEGSIIEYSYTIKSDFLFNLQPWTFQGEYPCLWSEYEVRIPQYFNYVFITQGYVPFHIEETKSDFQNYTIVVSGGTGSSQMVSLNGNVNINRWVMKDVPALKKENYTSTISNYVSKIEFQLSQYRFPNYPVRNVMGSWLSVGEKLNNDEHFAADLSSDNKWLDDDLKTVTKGSSTKLEKARLIYDFVRDNFTCTSHYGVKIDHDNSLKSVFKSRSGSVAEINLLIDAMLRHEGIDAYPVILSTRDRGLTHDMYPLIDKFNYVICSAHIDSTDYFLDASEPMLGFGKLDSKCYNGHARLVKNIPLAIYLDADSLKEKKLTRVTIVNKDNAKMDAGFESTLGYFESIDVREKVKATSLDDFFKSIRKVYNLDIDIAGKEIDSLKKYDHPVKIKYDFSFDKQDADVVYFNPMMAEGYKENPFSSAERFYPVEMPCASDETYIFYMEIPDGYVVDELPKSVRITFNDQDGYFEYLIDRSGNSIQMRSRLTMNKATFMPEEYKSLRDFYSVIVKKHSEQIVFKKKKA